MVHLSTVDLTPKGTPPSVSSYDVAWTRTLGSDNVSALPAATPNPFGHRARSFHPSVPVLAILNARPARSTVLHTHSRTPLPTAPLSLLASVAVASLNATAGHAFRSYGHAFTLSPLAWERNACRPCLPPFFALVVCEKQVVFCAATRRPRFPVHVVR